MADLTLAEVGRQLKRAGCTIQVSFSSGQHHAYIHRGKDLVAYARGEFEDSIERGLQLVSPKAPIGVVPELPAIADPRGAREQHA